MAQPAPTFTNNIAASGARRWAPARPIRDAAETADLVENVFATSPSFPRVPYRYRTADIS